MNLMGSPVEGDKGVDMTEQTEHMTLNVTYAGESQNLPQQIHHSTHDADIKWIARESLELPPGTFDLFVVDRFPETGHYYLRPKVPFGA